MRSLNPTFYTSVLLTALFLFSCSQSEPQKISCADHDWQSVEKMVFPYLEADMQTAMIMQGQSSEYKTHMAADFALTFEESYPDSVVQILRKLEACNTGT